MTSFLFLPDGLLDSTFLSSRSWSETPGLTTRASASMASASSEHSSALDLSVSFSVGFASASRGLCTGDSLLHPVHITLMAVAGLLGIGISLGIPTLLSQFRLQLHVSWGGLSSWWSSWWRRTSKPRKKFASSCKFVRIFLVAVTFPANRLPRDREASQEVKASLEQTSSSPTRHGRSVW